MEWAKFTKIDNYVSDDINFSQVIFTPYQNQVYLIGGWRDQEQLVGEKMENAKIPTRVNYQVHIDDSLIKSMRSVLKLRKEMLRPRYCYGYMTMQEGRYIVVAGGVSEMLAQKFSKYAEMYDIVKDRWLGLPLMNEEKFSPSIVEVSQQYIYSFGGCIKSNGRQPKSDLIERVDVKEVLDIYTKHYGDSKKLKNLELHLETTNWEKIELATT